MVLGCNEDFEPLGQNEALRVYTEFADGTHRGMYDPATKSKGLPDEDYDATTGMVINWHRIPETDSSANARLRYRMIHPGESDWVTADGESMEFWYREERVNRVILTNLEPGSVYEFKLRKGGERFRFRTMPSTLDERPLKIVMTSDHQSPDWNQFAHDNAKMAAFQKPDMFVVAGDFVNDEGRITLESATRWANYLDNLYGIDEGYFFYDKEIEGKFFEKIVIPHVSVVGNHETGDEHHIRWPADLYSSRIGYPEYVASNWMQLLFHWPFSSEGFYSEFNPDHPNINPDYAREDFGKGGFGKLSFSDYLLLIGLAQPLEDFTWDSGFGFLNTAFNSSYNVISRTNLILDEVHIIDMPENRKRVILAEARFLRAVNYTYLYNFFGPVPLVTSSNVTPEDRPSRASSEEIAEFVESELLAASEDLPITASEFGRATWGAALGMLSRFHLNRKNWKKTAEVSGMIIDSGVYSLFESENRTELFDFGNENNDEFIYVHEYLPIDGYGNTLLPHIVPPNYQFEAPPKENFAAQYQTLSNFLDSFHPDDQRKDAIITEYLDTSGEIVQLGEDNARSLKFPEDLSATGRSMGNNHPIIRYADILLHRAEALNEIHGPNQDSVDLINEVRRVAGVPLYDLSDFSSTESFRDSILAERGWEFFTEGLRRQDLIRHGKFIEFAVERGKSASDHHIRYPIPQQQMDRNPNLNQNPGY